MKARNSNEVARGYVLFAVSMLFAILVGLGCVWSFFMTADREVARMELRSREYDATFSRQIALTERVDSLYNNIALLNSGRQFNEIVLKNRISTQKMDLMRTLDDINQGDALLYGKMAENINTVLQVKDSISLVSGQVQQVKGDLQRCIQDNRTAARRMIFNTQN